MLVVPARIKNKLLPLRTLALCNNDISCISLSLTHTHILIIEMGNFYCNCK